MVPQGEEHRGRDRRGEGTAALEAEVRAGQSSRVVWQATVT